MTDLFADCSQATWLLRLAKQDPESARKAFSAIPDFVIRDMTAWLSFVIRAGQPDLVASCRLDVLIAFLVEMLQRGDLVQSPIVQAKIVELLLTMLSPQLGRRHSRGKSRVSKRQQQYATCLSARPVCLQPSKCPTSPSQSACLSAASLDSLLCLEMIARITAFAASLSLTSLV